MFSLATPPVAADESASCSTLQASFNFSPSPIDVESWRHVACDQGGRAAYWLCLHMCGTTFDCRNYCGGKATYLAHNCAGDRAIPAVAEPEPDNNWIRAVEEPLLLN